MATLTVKIDDALYQSFGTVTKQEHCSMSQKVRDLVAAHVSRFMPKVAATDAAPVVRTPTTPEEQERRRKIIREGKAISILTGHVPEPDPDFDPFSEWLDEQWIMGAITAEQACEMAVAKVDELLATGQYS